MSRTNHLAIQDKFQELFNSTPITVRSPGRINLIGEHTDYNQGYVLPAAIDKEIIFEIGLNSDQTCNLYAMDLKEQFSFESANPKRSSHNWANYLVGIVDQFNRAGYPMAGFDCVFGGDIPVGAGMSSSAALECGLAYGLSHLLGMDLSRKQIAKIGQEAENQFVGMQCGLMDQYANMLGLEHHLLLMDCRAEDHQAVEIDLRNYGLYLFNSKVKHELSSSEYNIRRKECEQGVTSIRKAFPQVGSLRDCDASMLNSIQLPVIRQRCEYVIEENQRVLDGCNDLRSGALEAFGEKMYLSHKGLSQKYQVSCAELDLLVELTEKEDAVLGARMMGGGFGGCTINLIHLNEAQRIIDDIFQKYARETGKEMEVYPVQTADGTSVVKNINPHK